MQSSLAIAEPFYEHRVNPATASALQVRLHDNEAALETLRGEWDELLDHSEQCVFFLRWSWVRTWWHTYAPPGSRLYLLACRDAEGRLVGLAPLYWQERRFAGLPHIRDLNLLGTGAGIKTSEHLDLFARRGFERAVAEACAAFLWHRHDWDRLWLWNVPERSKLFPHLQSALGASARSTVCDRPHYIDTNADWETVKQSWTRKFGHNIERCTRNLHKQYAAEFQRITAPDELEPALEEFIRLHQLRWHAKGQSGSFAYPKFEAFLRTTMQQALHEGRLGFWTFKLDGKCVATLLAFIDNGVAHYFQGGFDMEFAKHSLGSVMVAQCIQACVNDPAIREFDFMGGGAVYKDSWTKTVREAYELELLRPGFRSLLYTTGQKTRRILSRLRRALRARWQTPQATS
jgi:CelD/BcsL family acetyltransferase involved in cellulose biosynthesis